MALYLNGKKLSGDAIAAKPWTTLGTLTEGGSSLNVSGYTELLIYPKINGATYFDPIVIDVSEFNNASTIHFSIYQDNSHSYMGGLDYSDGSISFRRILISGWTSCDCVVKATCFSSGGSTTHHYSTDEQVVGTWIDGSPLYEKTQYGGISITEADTWYDTSITGIDKTVMVSGSLLRSGEEVGLGTFNSRWILRNNTVKISLSDLSGDTWSLMSITVRYTKSST